MAKRAARRLWILATLLVLFLLVKVFVADVYRIESDSMRPTLFGGDEGEALTEWVLVRYERDPQLERYDLVVGRPPGGGRPIVKRVGGLPGESVQIASGDLLIDGRRLSAAERRPAPILIFDDTVPGAADDFRFEQAPDGPWTRTGNEWVLDGHDVLPGSNQGMAFYRPPLMDDYLMPSGLRVRGKRQVNDALLELQFRLDEALVDRLRFSLTEEGDTFEAQIASHPHDAGFYVVRLDHDHAAENVELPQSNVELATDCWYTLRLANRDNHVSLWITEADLHLTYDYTANRAHTTTKLLGNPEHGEKSFGERVAFGGEGCRVRFAGVRISRDITYTDTGDHGTQQDVVLGLDEYFLLGDNSAHSRDSRSLGPFKRNQLIGRPVAVLWPPSRIRVLAGPAEPGE